MSAYPDFATEASDLTHEILTPGETFGPNQWGVRLAIPDRAALVIVGTRDDVLAALDRARDELLSYYTAEHENGYHLHAPEKNCPECDQCDRCGSSDGPIGVDYTSETGYEGLCSACLRTLRQV